MSWATRMSSRTPPSTRPRASVSIDSGVRDRCLPRKLGIAQKAQARSQPSATLRYAHGARGAGRGSSRRSRTPVGRVTNSTGASDPSPANPTTASTSGNAAASSSPARSARQPVTTKRDPGLRASSRARVASMDSVRASSTKAQVFTTTRSASPAEAAGTRPSSRSEPTTLSESTAFFGQPRVSTKKRAGASAGSPGFTPRILRRVGHEGRCRVRRCVEGDVEDRVRGAPLVCAVTGTA